MDIVTEPLRMFREGVQSYQPANSGISLEPETGEPQPSLRNLKKLLDAGLVIRDILVRPTGALIQFSTGEQYLASGLRVGDEANPARTLALIEVAVKAGFGPWPKLLRMYSNMDADYEGILPDRRDALEEEQQEEAEEKQESGVGPEDASS
jgi:hypothetical protein